METGEPSCKSRSHWDPQNQPLVCKNGTVQNLHGHIKKSPCEAQPGSYFQPQSWNLISLTPAGIVVIAGSLSLPLFFLMRKNNVKILSHKNSLLHFAQMDRHRKSHLEIPVPPSAALTHWHPQGLGSRNAEQKPAPGSAHLNPDFRGCC